MMSTAPKSPLVEDRLSGRRSPLIAAHRGSAGGNIIQNTLGAFIAAIRLGADIVECDVSRTSDGRLLVFHDSLERMNLGLTNNISEMTYDEVLSVGLYNSNDERTSQHVNTLDDILSGLKGKALINLDRGWDHWEQMLDAVDRHGMADEVLIKSPIRPDLLEVLDSRPVKYMYMPMLRSPEQLDSAGRYDLNIVAVELIFESTNADVVRPEFIRELKERKYLLWVNSLKLNDRDKLCGDLDDTASILKGPEHGWGALIDMGFDILQTDWPSLLKEYLSQRS
ncbi:MAG TPA: glycerophosphodiester phosphodiesterase family protein [Spirochaetia bacterium]|nr:glycerophosphodiester phosphodiesterase family protein [Spirochaetia bacterium]